MFSLTDLAEWQQLQQCHQQLVNTSLNELFAQDAQRAAKFSGEIAGIHIDYAKNLLDDRTLQTLLQLAKTCQVPEKILQLQQGKIVNYSENKPAWHTALRSRQPVIIDGEDYRLAIQQRLTQMATKAATLSDVKDIINIGIGGSDLGPRLAIHALQEFAINAYRFHFISTMDANQITALLPRLNPKTTLVIIASKSFATEETLRHAHTLKQWLGTTRAASHCWAVTAQPEKAANFGILPENIFAFWDWVGGRYSLWSVIGLPIVLQIGIENFQQLLAGARAIDEQVITTPLANNLPIILGLLNVWYTQFWQTQTHAIAPYDWRLINLPAYLQQLEMESNGKNVRVDNVAVNYATSPIIWGDMGTNGQHAFHQLLHQGTWLIPIDFIISRQVPHSLQAQHRALWAHALSQANVLLTGYQATENYRTLPGNRPSTFIVLPALTPYTLGALLAIYEYKVLTSSIIWQINAFDQWGVERGKNIATQIDKQLTEGMIDQNLDSSTMALMQLFLKGD